MRKTLIRTARMETLLGALLLSASLTGWLTGCGEETTSSADETAQAEREPEAAPEGDEAADEEAGPVVEDPTFELRASAAGPYQPGQEASFEVRLTPRGRYHVNQDFPMTIAVTAPEGVQAPAAPLGNDDAEEFTEEVARFDVPVTPSAAGEHTVTAVVDFAVCTPEACMPDRRTLALVLPVQ
ncbi:MAG: hypothetical protein RLO52_29690 [Sandaracinaceae bacterium]